MHGYGNPFPNGRLRISGKPSSSRQLGRKVVRSMDTHCPAGDFAEICREGQTARRSVRSRLRHQPQPSVAFSTFGGHKGPDRLQKEARLLWWQPRRRGQQYLEPGVQTSPLVDCRQSTAGQRIRGPSSPAMSGRSSSGVIPPFLAGCIRRTYAAIFSFCAGVMPRMPHCPTIVCLQTMKGMFGRSLL
jgi:hypothetical protein